MSRSKNKTRRRQLRFDTLEARDLPTGDLLLQAFHDANENGMWESGENGVAGLVVNYQLLAGGGDGDVATASDGLGAEALAAGDYSWYATMPTGYDILTPFEIFGQFTIVDTQSTTKTFPLVQPVPENSLTIEADTDWIYRDDNVSFWAYSTADPAPTYTEIDWDFNYNGTTFVPDASATGELAEHAFSANGAYTVASRATLSTGGTHLATFSVDVHHLPPTVEAPEYFETTAGVPITLTVTETHEADIDSIEWWISENGEDYELDSGSTELSAEYEFPYFGTYDFGVTVTDVDGEVGEVQFQVYVDEATPVGGVTVSADASHPVDEGNLVTFTVNELSWDDALDDVSIYADWTGSGEFDLVDTEEWAGNLWNNGVASFSHYYDDGKPTGAYNAKIRIENEGGEFSEYPVDVFVRDLAPVATLTAGSPDSGYVAHQVTDIAFSNQNVWAIRETTSIGFFDAGDPSTRDFESQKYHFIIRKYNAEGTEVVETTESMDQAEPWIKLPQYKAGQSYEVEAWLTDKDGAAFPHQKINVVFEGLADGEPSGTGAPTHRFYGTMKVQGEELPESYNRYGYAPEIKKSLGVGEQLTVELVLDDWSRDKIDDDGTTIKYIFHVVEEHFTTFGSPVVEYTIEQTTGTFTVPFVYPEDYRITVNGAIQITGSSYYLAESPFYQVVATTPESQNWFDEVSQLFTMLQQTAEQFGEKASQILSAITDHTSQFVDTLIAGFTGAANQIVNELTSTPLLKNALFKWVGLTENLTLPENFDPFDSAQLTDFLLKFSGLTWDHISDVLLQELGDGNVAAITEVASWLQNLNDENTNSAGSMRQFVNDLVGKVEGITVENILTKIVDEVTKPTGPLVMGLAKALPQLASKFVPGAGQIMAAVKGLVWLVDNRNQLQQLFNKLINEGGDALINFNAAGLQTALVDGFRQALPTAMSFLAGQIGLGSLPRDIKKAVAFVPTTVDLKLREAIRKMAKTVLKGGTGGGRTDGLLNGTVPYQFQYKEKTYELFATKESSKVFIKLHDKSTNGKTIILKSNSFLQTAQGDFGDVAQKASILAGAKKPAAGQPRRKPSVFKDLKNVQQTFATEVIELADRIKEGKCVAVDGGCFAAGTKLWTPDGYRNVEQIKEGELVFSRDQYRPDSLIEAKPVEKVFTRFTEVLHIHVGGQVIRTTQEHPFFAHRKGWTAAVDLAQGDWILTAADDWKQVEELYATGVLEVVYNLRVSEHHTYFVGDETWGWAAWAHNQICGHRETTAAHNRSYARSGDDPAITDPANEILKTGRVVRGMTPAKQGDNLTLAYLQIVGESHPPIFASNSDSYPYDWPTVMNGEVLRGKGVNMGARNHAEVKAMVRAVTELHLDLSGKSLVIFVDHDPCKYCDKDRGIENAARISRRGERHDLVSKWKDRDDELVSQPMLL